VVRGNDQDLSQQKGRHNVDNNSGMLYSYINIKRELDCQQGLDRAYRAPAQVDYNSERPPIIVELKFERLDHGKFKED
jgi:hypothetical protein